MRRIVPVVLMLMPLVFGLRILINGTPDGAQADHNTETRLIRQLGQLPLYFIENGGQVDRQVGYFLQGERTSVYFTSSGVVFALTEPQRAETPPAPHIRPVSLEQPTPRERWAVKLEFLGANPDARPEGLNRTGTTVSYLKGPREAWKSGLSTYAGVVYRTLWPGVDLEYAGTQGQLKYTFTVSPGADASRIRLAYRGASGLRVTKEGRLEIQTPAGSFAEDAPYVYQEVGGQKVAVDAAYKLEGDAFTFRLGRYDRTLPLVLDPAVLVYAGYIGGSARDEALDVAVDSSGNAYVLGTTYSADGTFPVTVGPDTSFNGGDRDVFIAKLNAAGTALLYAGYIGGSGPDIASGIAVDAAGSAYVTGYTGSTETTFPVAVGPDTSFNGGVRDAFVAKVNSAGTALVYAGYIGGSGNDYGYDVAVDATGNAYVTGSTDSTEATFPVKLGPDTSYAGNTDTFAAKINPEGSSLVYAGFIGGSNSEFPGGIAVDTSGNAYITGWTQSTESSFPVHVGPDTSYNGGSWDAFVVKVDTAGTAFVYAGYIGGSGTDYGDDIAVDSSGNAYVGGYTSSPEANFPVKGGPDLSFNGGSWDAFVSRVNAAGAALDYAGYIGGAGDDYVNGIGVDASGNAYVTGSTNSTEVTFPVSAGPDASFNGGSWDGFVSRVKATGTALDYAGYIGGAGDDYINRIAIDTYGNAYVAGSTTSTEATFPIKMGPDLSYNGGARDAFIAKVGFATSPPAVTAIVSAASYAAGGVSPGEIVAVYGTDLGPPGGVANSGYDSSTGRLPTTLGLTAVTFDGQAAPLFYVSAGQINVQVPYEVAGKSSASVVVTYNGAASVAFSVPIVTAHPGVFVHNDRAIITDNYTGALITSSSPIARGAYANVWATGPGVVSPAASTGAPASGSPLSWAANPQVWINGSAAEVAFAGLTPGLAGLLQITVKIPGSAPAGAGVPLRISINGVDAQAYIGGAFTNSLTIAIR